MCCNLFKDYSEVLLQNSQFTNSKKTIPYEKGIHLFTLLEVSHNIGFRS